MKKFLLFLLVAFSFTVNAQHVHVTPHVTPHISTVHVTPHVTPHVTTVHPTTVHVSEPVHVTPHVSEVHATTKAPTIHETPVYSPIKEVSAYDFKMYPNGSYYYLMMNNHTKQYDTIKGATKEELKSKLEPVTGKAPMSNGTVVSILIGLVFCISIIVLIIQSQNKKEKTWEEAAKELDPSESYNKEQ